MNTDSKKVEQPCTIAGVSNRFPQFNKYGSSLDGEDLDLLKRGSQILIYARHERYSDGTFATEINPLSRVFKAENRLYYFTYHPSTGQVDSVIPLNMSREECTSGRFGVYFEVLK